MTFKDFDEYQATLLEKVVEMKDTKGKEYAHDLDRFVNFKRLGKALGLPSLQVAWVYCYKHIDGIASFIKTGKEFSNEKIEGRIVDAITYFTLIGGMIEEEKRREEVICCNCGNPILKGEMFEWVEDFEVKHSECAWRVTEEKVSSTLTPLSDENSGKQQPFEYDLEYDPTDTNAPFSIPCSTCRKTFLPGDPIVITSRGFEHVKCPVYPNR